MQDGLFRGIKSEHDAQASKLAYNNTSRHPGVSVRWLCRQTPVHQTAYLVRLLLVCPAWCSIKLMLKHYSTPWVTVSW
jgi:hypothetical protein